MHGEGAVGSDADASNKQTALSRGTGDSITTLSFQVMMLNGKAISISDGSPNDTILQAKNAIQAKEGIPAILMIILADEKELTDDMTIEKSGLKDGAAIFLILKLCSTKPVR